MKVLDPISGELRSTSGRRTLFSWNDEFSIGDQRWQEKALQYIESQRNRLPESVERWLDHVTGKDVMRHYEVLGLDENGEPIRGREIELYAADVKWRDPLTTARVAAADGTQVLNTTTETVMCPDFTFGGDVLEVGDLLCYTLLFDVSTVITTPGTQTYRMRWGGVAGTSLGASGAFAPDPTAASTTVSQGIIWYVAVRSVGSAGSMFAMGHLIPNDFDDASAAAIVGNLNMLMIPVSAPAATGSLDTTTAKALSPTVQFSVSTSTTQLTNHIAILESLN